MIRALIVLLVLANGFAFAWNRGWLAQWVGDPTETLRVAKQWNADRLRPVPLSRLDEEPAPPPSPPARASSRVAQPVREPAHASSNPRPGGNASTNADAKPGTDAKPAVETKSVPDAKPAEDIATSPSIGSTAVPAPFGAAAAPGTGTVPAPAAGTAAVPAPTPGMATSTANAAPPVCMAFAPIDEERAPRMREALEASGAHVDAQRIEQGASYLVYLPPAASMAEAQSRLADLRRLGRNDAFLIPEGPYRLGISLGVYRAESAARAMVARLAEAGERDALVAPRAPIQVRMRLEARWPGRDAAAAASMIGAQFDAPARDCE